MFERVRTDPQDLAGASVAAKLGETKGNALVVKISWLDKRYSAGGWHRVKNHPNLPAWIVKGLGGSTVH